MIILKEKLTVSQLTELAAVLYVEIIKAVADESIQLRIREIVNDVVCR